MEALFLPVAVSQQEDRGRWWEKQASLENRGLTALRINLQILYRSILDYSIYMTYSLLLLFPLFPDSAVMHLSDVSVIP